MANFTNSDELRKEIIKKQDEFRLKVGKALSPMGFVVTDFNIGYMEFGFIDFNNLWVVCKSKISIERNQFIQGKYKLVTSLGVAGSFDMEQGDITRFYIQLGKLLGDSSLLEYIKNALISYESIIDELHKKFSELSSNEA